MKKQLIQVIPNLPGATVPNYPVRLRIDRYLSVEGQGKDDEEWTSIPVQSVNVNGNPVSIALNREYLLKALRFGLNKLEIEGPLTPMLLSNGGKQIVISPLNLDGPKVADPVQPTGQTTTPASNQPAPQEQPGAPFQERKEEVPRTVKPPEAINTEGRAAENQGAEKQTNGNGANNGNGSAVKSLVEQVDQIKENLRNVIRDLSTIIDTVKAAEKEKRATDKEIEAVRAKLRQIQNVSI